MCWRDKGDFLSWTREYRRVQREVEKCTRPRITPLQPPPRSPSGRRRRSLHGCHGGRRDRRGCLRARCRLSRARRWLAAQVQRGQRDRPSTGVRRVVHDERADNGGAVALVHRDRYVPVLRRFVPRQSLSRRVHGVQARRAVEVAGLYVPLELALVDDDGHQVWGAVLVPYPVGLAPCVGRPWVITRFM